MKSGSRRRPTIAVVAQRAGVSPATVSRVMNGRFLGEPDVAERVRRAAVELDYAPSPVARSLALGETNTVAFVVPDIANPTFQTMLSSLSKGAAMDGYRVLVADSAEDPEDEAILAAEIRRACDGLVLAAPRMPDERLRALLPQLQPVLLINRASPSFDAPSLSVDYGNGIQRIAEHLYDLDHRHLVYLEGPPHSATNTSRVDGLEAFARRVGDVRIDRIVAGSSATDGYGLAAAVRATRATAALAYNDLVAVGLMSGLVDAGVSVPDEISIAGFDDIQLVRYVTPRLTTASVPYGPLGADAWQRLRALIRGDVPSSNVVFQPRLQVRDSTGRAPARSAVSEPVTKAPRARRATT